MTPFFPVLEAFEREGICYVMVGGMAAVAHGVNRFTADVDFVVKLDEENALRAVRALTHLGLKPRAPVNPERFSVQAERESWVRDKNMRVFTFYDPKDPFLSIDLFVEYPMEFEGFYRRSVVKSLGSCHVRVCSIEDLIRMKRGAGRPKDLQDIQLLEVLRSDEPTS